MVKILIDIGCFNAKTNSETYKLLNRKRDKWFGYMIEPNPHLKDDIHKNLSGLSYSYHQIGISDDDGEFDFYMGKYGFTNRRSPKDKTKCMRSSLCNDKSFIKKHLTENKIKIKTLTLKNFIEKNNIETIDLLKIDTEGKDFDIIKKFFSDTNDKKIYPTKIITEDICKGEEEEIQREISIQKKEFLESFGYKYSKMDDYNSCFILS